MLNNDTLSTGWRIAMESSDTVAGACGPAGGLATDSSRLKSG